MQKIPLSKKNFLIAIDKHKIEGLRVSFENFLRLVSSAINDKQIESAKEVFLLELKNKQNITDAIEKASILYVSIKGDLDNKIQYKIYVDKNKFEKLFLVIAFSVGNEYLYHYTKLSSLVAIVV